MDQQAATGSCVAAEIVDTVDARVLVVDLDGSLLRTNLLIESLLALARRQPWTLWRVPLWLLRGRAAFKHELARRALPDVATLPRNAEVVAYLQQQRDRGRRLVLATGSDAIAADAVASGLGLFDEVLASDGRHNLSGAAKRDRLIGRFGEGGFDYIGNSWADLPVWRAARRALVVEPRAGLRAALLGRAVASIVFERPRHRPRALLQAMRPQHWLKNLLLFVPLALTLKAADGTSVADALLAFCAFSLCASSVYLLNDLLDLSADRRHPYKRERALASGQLPLGHALLAMPLLLLAALGLGWWLLPAFGLLLAAYFGLMLVYSLGLKQLPLLDVLVLATGYSLRVAGGALVIGLRPSPWLIAFSMLLFFSLALIKRYAELVLMKSMSAPSARGYRVEDRDLIAAQGVASGDLAVLVLALYTSGVTADTAVGAQGLMWPLHLLLFYWVHHLWLQARRGRMPNDPLAFAISDRLSLGLLIGMTALAVAAL